MSAASRAARAAELKARYLAQDKWYQRATSILEDLRECRLRRALADKCEDIEQRAADDAVDSADEEQCAYAYRGLSRSDFL
jgi:hypothetical protein